MKVLIISFIIISFALQASGLSITDIEWAPAVEGTLHTGNNVSNDPYTVKAVQFSSPVQGYKTLKGDIVPETAVEPMVYVELYKKGIFLRQALLTLQSSEDINPDYEFKVSATGFASGNSINWVQEYYDPWATVAISLRGEPDVGITISTDKSSYNVGSDQIITATITVKNNGYASAKNVELKLNTGELGLRGGPTSQLTKTYMELKKGESDSFDIVLIVPYLVDQKTFTLAANAKFMDVKDIEFKSSMNTTFTILPRKDYFTVGKSISKNRIYLNDIFMVKLTIANGGTFDMNDIVLNDSMDSNFELESNTPLAWKIPVMRPGEWKDIEYSVRPMETNLDGFKLPAATASFTINNRQFNVSSEAPTVIVNGPKIILNKTVDKQKVNIDDTVTVTVIVKNTGNIPTRTEVRDTLPESVSIINGSMSLNATFLKPDDSETIIYVIRTDRQGYLELPAAVANYTGVDYRGMMRSKIESGRPVITVFDPTMDTNTTSESETQYTAEVIPTEMSPSETKPTKLTPGFEIITGVIMLVFVRHLKRGI